MSLQELIWLIFYTMEKMVTMVWGGGVGGTLGYGDHVTSFTHTHTHRHTHTFRWTYTHILCMWIQIKHSSVCLFVTFTYPCDFFQTEMIGYMLLLFSENCVSPKLHMNNCVDNVQHALSSSSFFKAKRFNVVLWGCKFKEQHTLI